MTQVVSGPSDRDPLSLVADGTDYLAAVRRPLVGLRIAYSPRLGNFPVDPRVAATVRDAVAALQAHGYVVEERELELRPHHRELAALWVRTIGVHYGAIAAHLKADGLDLLGAHADELTPEFRAMLEASRQVGAVEHALDDVLRTQVFDALQDVLAEYDVIVAPTLAVPPVRNAMDGNTVGPTEINGETVDPLIGWCMTYPINFTGHPAISVPAGLTEEGLPVGLQIIGRRFADETVLAAAAAFERIRPWFHAYPGLSPAA